MKQTRVTYYVGLSAAHDPSLIERRKVRRRMHFQRLIIVERMLTAAYDAGTFTDARGLWCGTHEPTLLFQTICTDDETTRTRARRIAADIRYALEQECVGLSFEPVDFETI